MCGMALVSILQPRGLELVERIGRRRLDPVDPARQQRRGARRDVGDRQQHHALALGNAVLVPVLGVALELGALARRPCLHLPRAGARRRLAVGLPVLADLLEIVGAGDGEAVEQRRHHRVDAVGLQFDLVVVDLAIGRRAARRRRSAPLRPSRSNDGDLSFERAVEAEDHVVGSEWRAVMELHALAQLEDPFRRIGRVLDTTWWRGPGTSLAGSVADDRSHITSGSYIV